MSISVLLIEHADVEGLYPFALTHPSWQMRTGAFTVVERWAACLPEAPIHVHSHRLLHEALYRSSSAVGVADIDQSRSLLVVVANCLLERSQIEHLAAECAAARRPSVVLCGTEYVGAILPSPPSNVELVSQALDEMQGQDVDVVHVDGMIIDRLWKILDRIASDVHLDAELVSTRVHPQAHVHPTAILDESKGSVIIDAGADIGPYAVIQGPCSIGTHAVVKPHAHITHSIIGPYCKVSGEISCSIFQGYANKQHYGFVGHSIIGEWVNLGAGTTTSNLKNTYHSVKPRMPWGREDSGQMFLGSMIGDFTRTAIGTMLPTGGVYGVSSHIMSTGMASSSIRSFVWSDGVVYDRERSLQTCDVMMRRRGLSLTDQHIAVLDWVREHDV